MSETRWRANVPLDRNLLWLLRGCAVACLVSGALLGVVFSGHATQPQLNPTEHENAGGELLQVSLLGVVFENLMLGLAYGRRGLALGFGLAVLGCALVIMANAV
jgi:hypothetical protein